MVYQPECVNFPPQTSSVQPEFAIEIESNVSIQPSYRVEPSSQLT